MLPTVARIFVSSTWLDLQPERHAVEDSINRMNAGKFVGMEYFGSRPETTDGASLDEVDRSDIPRSGASCAVRCRYPSATASLQLH